MKIICAASIIMISIGLLQALRAEESRADRQKMIFESVLASYQKSPRGDFRKADALFELGRNEEAIKVVNAQLDALEPGNKINRWMHGGNTGFIAWPGIDTYIRYQDRMDQKTRDRYRRLYTGGVFYQRLSTSNHVTMAAVTRSLATQVWGKASFKADPFFMANDSYIQEMTARIKNPQPSQVWGNQFSNGDETGDQHVRNMLDNIVQQGPGEYASRPYGAQNLLPLLTLSECSRDPEIRHRAQMAYEYCLIQLAPAWLRGHLATFSPRSYPDMLTQQPWGGATLPWFYFGGITPKDLSSCYCVRAATSRQSFPDILHAAGTDRSKPYTYRALINKWTLTHYMHRHYALFCRSSKARGRGFAGQSYPCGVMWDEPDVTRASHLWVTNPVADRADGESANLTNGIHTHGVSKYEEQLLHENALISVYDIDPTFRNPYILGYVPGGARAVINDCRSGRIFLHYGSVLIAVQASQPFDWNPSVPMRAAAGKPNPGDSEFRIMATQAAVVLETAPPEEFPGASPSEQLQAFRKKLIELTRIQCTKTTLVSATYTDRRGNLLTCSYGGDDSINGKKVDYPNWPALESPWIRQEKLGGLLTVTDGNRTRTYDFQQWRVDELIKN